ncbi:hypothetical protein F5ESL0236_02155 [Lactobacillus sp. ESL0236]|uniref:lactococcin 972 family bacteriocin n=1 Tax=unclassified Lactobacillus TaxID=2620435 RepID=UPI000EFADA91|nr:MULTISPECIES: lactococcin 972 family bacteriocin [unclassified Lactobacillus]RMC40732.1 hypothetical protein F5ESL0237_02155 [Lactobacillus sp. ESL0237]RMC44489.1 hypothetical protein F5ESL0234_02150 [Lactobacillus sp. ESL0234]RMC45796.1 hypothetical protein F5ESL0236_02155 [Lactobacillus sp. ESL0236]
MSKKLTTALATSDTSAPYEWHHIDSGDWLFGVYGTKVQSTYKHSSRNHTAAAKNANGDGRRRRDYARAGSTAFSKVNVAIKGNKFRG